MGIQFYNGYNNYNSYNNYHREIPQVSIEEAKLKEEQRTGESGATQTADDFRDTAKNIDNRARISSLEDISLTFNKEESFDYLNSDSSVKSLDMEKAISDLKKDDILQEYQYFVGSSKNLFENPDGVVIAKQNN